MAPAARSSKSNKDALAINVNVNVTVNVAHRRSTNIVRKFTWQVSEVPRNNIQLYVRHNYNVPICSYINLQTLETVAVPLSM